MEHTTDITINCPKGATTLEEIDNVFDAGDICMNCPNLVYRDGVVSCGYNQV